MRYALLCLLLAACAPETDLPPCASSADFVGNEGQIPGDGVLCGEGKLSYNVANPLPNDAVLVITTTDNDLCLSGVVEAPRILSADCGTVEIGPIVAGGAVSFFVNSFDSYLLDLHFLNSR